MGAVGQAISKFVDSTIPRKLKANCAIMATFILLLRTDYERLVAKELEKFSYQTTADL